MPLRGISLKGYTAMKKAKFDREADRFIRRVRSEKPSLLQVSALLACLMQDLSDADVEKLNEWAQVSA